MSNEIGEIKAASHDDRLRVIMGWTAVILVTVAALIFFGRVVWLGFQRRVWLDVARTHFAAIVGLPAAAIAALFLVLVLRMADGPIEVEIGTLKFKGAAAPIVFWLICFLSIAAAIKMVY